MVKSDAEGWGREGTREDHLRFADLESVLYIQGAVRRMAGYICVGTLGERYGLEI